MVGVATLVLLALALPAAADEVPLARWRQRLASAAAGDRNGVTAVAGTTAVVLPDGSRLPVDEGALPSLTPSEQAARLDTLSASADQLDRPSAGTDAIRRGQDALRSHEFDPDAPGPSPRVPRWLERVLSAIDRFLRTFIGGTFQPDLSSPVGWVRLLIGLVMLTLVTLLTVRLIRRGSAVGPPDVADPAEAAHEEPSEEVWRRRYRQARDADELSDALRCLYLAALLRLDARGVVDFRPGRTDALYALELSERAPALLSAFRVLSDAFARVHYGNESVDEDGLTAAEEAEDELHRLTERKAA